eukprot:TRINITY_DN1700_c0_g1_i1.p1 TRINITY_DN1700_c0_g1~~TRINITY_DN1700_c0_g1_i1.p1  ORF type:complete len:132 (+),score=13.37 TRINITY_DN1700_c0_g1_i1:94-489(+)
MRQSFSLNNNTIQSHIICRIYSLQLSSLRKSFYVWMIVASKVSFRCYRLTVSASPSFALCRSLALLNVECNELGVEGMSTLIEAVKFVTLPESRLNCHFSSFRLIPLHLMLLTRFKFKLNASKSVCNKQRC